MMRRSAINRPWRRSFFPRNNMWALASLGHLLAEWLTTPQVPLLRHVALPAAADAPFFSVLTCSGLYVLTRSAGAAGWGGVGGGGIGHFEQPAGGLEMDGQPRHSCTRYHTVRQHVHFPLSWPLRAQTCEQCLGV